MDTILPGKTVADAVGYFADGVDNIADAVIYIADVVGNTTEIK